MQTLRLDWTTIESLATRHKPQSNEDSPPLLLPSNHTPSSPRYVELGKHYSGKSLRHELFGSTCFLCGTHNDEKRLVIHRKDGCRHRPELLRHEKYYRTLDPQEWASLCRRCHRAVHWAMDTFGLSWSSIVEIRNATRQSIG